jgi:hypothetical protein
MNLSHPASRVPLGYGCRILLSEQFDGVKLFGIFRGGSERQKYVFKTVFWAYIIEDEQYYIIAN